MDFVNVHRRTEDLGRPVGGHVEVVAPFVAVKVRGNGGGCRTDFAELCERVHLHMQVAVGSVNLEAVEFAFANVRNENFPDACRAKHAHLVAAAVPAVEAANHGDGAGVRCPNGKVDALETLVFNKVCAELAVKFVMRAGGNQVAVKVRKDGEECIRVGERVFVAVVLLDNQVVKERFVFFVENRFEESRVTDFHEIKFIFTVARFSANETGLRLIGANHCLDTTICIQRVNSQNGKRIFRTKIPNGSHIFRREARKVVPFHTILL